MCWHAMPSFEPQHTQITYASLSANLQVHCQEEVEDFMKIASALLVNVGTLSADWVGGMCRAAAAAKSLGKPWVLDPVGAGATPFRTEVRRFSMPSAVFFLGRPCMHRPLCQCA